MTTASTGTILVASPRGFCAGVSYAVEIVDLVLERHGPPVYVRHEIVHNRYVVDKLRAQGARFVDDLAEVPEGSLLIFSAHGVSPAVRAEARRRRLRVVDATCPLVTKVHLQALKHARDGCEILLVGHRGHVEVEGTLGHAPQQMHLVETVEEVARLHVRNPERVAVVTQTTLSVDDTRAIVDAIRQRFPAVRTPPKDDICYATQNRQTAVKELARQSELVLVIGSPTSSNANRLVEVARNESTAARLIEDAHGIEPAWLANVSTVGLTAGASTPEPLVQEAIGRLHDLGFATVRDLQTAEENVTFPLPRQLRADTIVPSSRP
ncbi:MAG TPA: 4-hydroxy-3-methylbut-2-enyl diphosphate reductase [Candidatus Margulisiibacteriota bacterium]|nr:4-hydroxy-3-methylbut-2-enyl diphosphate reductase [Candidatus Margulisiibacteriota bacterium]